MVHTNLLANLKETLTEIKSKPIEKYDLLSKRGRYTIVQMSCSLNTMILPCQVTS